MSRNSNIAVSLFVAAIVALSLLVVPASMAQRVLRFQVVKHAAQYDVVRGHHHQLKVRHHARKVTLRSGKCFRVVKRTRGAIYLRRVSRMATPRPTLLTPNGGEVAVGSTTTIAWKMSTAVATGYCRVSLRNAATGLTVGLVGRLSAKRNATRYSVPWTVDESKGAYTVLVDYCSAGGAVISSDASDAAVNITDVATPTPTATATPTPPPTNPTATFNVMNYGAKADGVSDDAAAFAAAIKAAGTSGTVYAPSGTYNLVGDRVLGGDLDCNIALTSGLTLRGDGIGKTVLVGNGTTSCNIVGAVDVSNVSVADMTIRADASRRNATMQDAVKFEGVRNALVQRVDVQNLYMAIAVYGCQQVTFDSCSGSYNSTAFSALDISIGTTVYTGTSGITVSNCTATNNYGHGFRFYGLDRYHRTSGFAISNCTASDNGQDGFLFDYLTASRVSNCASLRNGVNGFELCGTTTVTLDHCTASNQTNAYCSGFVCDGDLSIFGPTSGNTISNSVATGNSYGYREWQGGAGNLVSGNNFSGNSAGPVYGAGTMSTGNTPY